MPEKPPDIQRAEGAGKAKLAAFGSSERHHDKDSPLFLWRRDRARRKDLIRGNRKPMKFRSLHHHTTFSYLDGFGMPEAHVRRATELNMDSLAVTEHGNVSSHVKMEKAALAAGVKPIYGCEFYVGPTAHGERRQMKNHLTVLAQTPEGYRNLLRLVTLSYSEGFYYEPTVSRQMLADHAEGLCVLSGCQGSELFTAIAGGKLVAEEDASFRLARRVARWYARTFPGRYFVEVQAFPELEKTCKANPRLERLARQLKLPIVATMDCHYTVFDETEMQKILHNVRPGERRTVEDMAREWGYDVPLCPPPNDRAIYRRLIQTGLSKDAALEAIANTELIAQASDVTLPTLPMLRFPLPPGRERKEFWRERIKEGWSYRGCGRLSLEERRRYKEQLKKEVEVIEDKEFLDYFLVVQDAVVWAKEAGILVGPARGSAAASLVCWLLRITEVNPMIFPNLVFERFIDVSRMDLPDIDLDFDSARRHEVRDYLVSKYGEECVNNIGTFTAYKSRLALDDVAKVHRIPKFEVEKIKRVLVERSSGDLRASATIEDTVDQFDEAGDVVRRFPDITRAMELEGNVRGFSVHAAGLVVSNGPITEVAAVYERDLNGHRVGVVSMDKYDAEEKGLLKLDFLGLSTMAVIAEALRHLDMSLEDLYSIPLDDEDVLDGFRENDIVGVFQFDGRAARSVNGALKPDSFAEICDVNALARPGPLHNGAATAYIEIKRGNRQPELAHPALEPILSGTKYQIVYQEQILRIVREIGDFDWTHAASIRRIISRKHGDAAFNRSWNDFLEGAKRLHGMSEETAASIWGDCITSGSYAFNAAHSTAYGMIGYLMMWLKRKHPEVFYASCLTRLPDSGGERGLGAGAIRLGRHADLLRDADQAGVSILTPRPETAQIGWEPLDAAISAGLDQIPGIGEKTARSMIAHREEADRPITKWSEYLPVKGIGGKTIEKIEEFVHDDDPFRISQLDRVLDDARATLAEAGLPAPTHRSIEVPYEQGSDTEVVWLGVATLRNLRDIFETNRARTGEALKPEDVKDPHLNEWMLVRGFDGTEILSLRFDRWAYPKFRNVIWKVELGVDVLLVSGVKKGFRAAREIVVNRLVVLKPEV